MLDSHRIADTSTVGQTWTRRQGVVSMPTPIAAVERRPPGRPLVQEYDGCRPCGRRQANGVMFQKTVAVSAEFRWWNVRLLIRSWQRNTTWVSECLSTAPLNC